MARNNNSSFTAGAVILITGGLVGAAVALLYAPQSGDKTRKELSRYAKKARKRSRQVMDAVEDFTDEVTDMAEAVGERAADILETGKDMAYGAKKGLLQAIEEGESRLMKQRSRLMKMIG